jgi:hypothetical protein
LFSIDTPTRTDNSCYHIDCKKRANQKQNGFVASSDLLLYLLGFYCSLLQPLVYIDEPHRNYYDIKMRGC